MLAETKRDGTNVKDGVSERPQSNSKFQRKSIIKLNRAYRPRQAVASNAAGNLFVFSRQSIGKCELVMERISVLIQ